MIDNLIEDIYKRLETPQEVSEENIDIFCDNLKALLKDRLSEGERSPSLRMSSIGKCSRQVYYDLTEEEEGEQLLPHTRLKFLYGDLIEELVLFLAREAGHKVTDPQKTVELDGVVGHIDAIIDGHLVDVKSASKFAFKKFKEGTLAEDDPFGYDLQLSGYSAALGDIDGAFLAMNKESGELALLKRSSDYMKMNFPHKKIENHKQNLQSDSPPDRPYEPVPDGKSGNMKLGVNCSYCSRKQVCWSDSNDGNGLRKFVYSYGPVFLTDVVRTPKVPEVDI